MLSSVSGLTGSMLGLPFEPGLGVLYDLRRSNASVEVEDRFEVTATVFPSDAM